MVREARAMTDIADLGMPPSQDPHIFWLAVYVMLTRCKSLDGLLLLHLPSRNSLNIGPPSYVLEEMQRLDALHYFYNGTSPQKSA